ncbi:hypothetical protein BJ546DRAFT_993336 [Cryomyces antarcticus]|uniref:RING-type domain-containing protein n=1 Tax=Cryomyces antarcticus TaxID=329879 RepID=A0ABR0LPM8_9PEZI|nr:hypothetical protein LTR16_002330 [Cryomyces antarcticus]
MSSNAFPAIASKSVNTSGQLSPAQSQSGSVSTGDSYGQRRGGGSGSFGAGASSRASPAPRKDQNARKQNKGSRRFRLADEDAFAESAAMRSTTGRKGQTSITHLMNFSLPPRPQNHQHFGHGRQTRRNPTWGLGSGYHAVDKARYVNANYRFIVDPRGDYHAQSVDADVYLDWNNILQILVSSQSQEASCPICLGIPVAPRMAKCGHIFCLPCLIRYMHSEDASNPPPEKRARWKKCPICWDSIYVSETRPVRWYTGQEGEPPREGGDVVLRLVMRETGSTLALPRDGADALAKGENVPWHFAAEVMDYARVMKGTEDYIVAQFDQDIQNLQTQEHEDELMFGEDTEWTRKAVRMINEAKEKIKGIGNPPSMTKKSEEPKAKRPPIQFNNSNDGVPEMYMIQHAARSGQSMPQAFSPSQSQTPTSPATGFSSVTSVHTPAVPFEHKKLSRGMSDAQQPAASALATSLAEFRNRQHAEYQPSEYFFYQALLHYYLSPLDIRILKAAFGSFASFPSTILPRVERISTGHIIDDDFRKRTKYLAHLPYGCEIGFLECDWRDTVAPEVLEKFMPEIERRRKKNQDKEAREEKERLRAERVEDKEFAAARRKRPSCPNDKFSADDFQPLTSSEVADSAPSVDADADADSVSISPPYSRRTHSSAYASLASPSTSPSAHKTVWGTTAVALALPDLRTLPMTQEVPADDGWLQGWEKDLMHEDDLVAQVQAASLGESSRAAAAAASGAKGKKKGKKITLMSTNARRGA